jgi:hypothetical protein
MANLEDINPTYFEYILIIFTLIWAISFIVFLIVAGNISRIKRELKHLNKRIAPKGSDHEFLGAREAFKGNKSEAVDNYLNYMYEITPHMQAKNVNSVWKKRHDIIRENIRKLKGV